MTLQQLSRRLDDLENVLSVELKTCHVCHGWPDMVIFLERPDGSPNYSGPWPADTFTCPNCCRNCGHIVRITSRPDGPQ